MASLSGKKNGTPPVLLAIRETLYTTSALGPFVSRIKNDLKPEFPWSNFVEANKALKKNDKATAIGLLKQIAAAEGLGTRIYLQAWHSLRGLGELPPEPLRGQIQGFIIENHMEQGLDLLAAYADHTARYSNYSGAGLVWDTRDPEIDHLIDDMLSVGQELMKWIGVNQNENLPIPPKGSIRLFMMSYDGSYSGEGPYAQFFQGQTAGYAIQVGHNLMMGLIKKAQSNFK
ncbi:MAG TPA: hypothetical protein VLE49_21130 [Anaerolineales bacterium]|nr:hypothetical protein [Anaerolineales bacterium]